MEPTINTPRLTAEDEAVNKMVDKMLEAMRPDITNFVRDVRGYVPNYRCTPGELEALGEKRKFIPKSLFSIMQYWSSNVSSDCVPVRYNPETGKREFLASRRKQRPWMDQYFMIGGRIAPNQTSKSNLVLILGGRELKVEITEGSLNEIGEFRCWNPEAQGELNYGWWSLQNVYSFELMHSSAAVFEAGDGLTTDFKWFSEIPADFCPEFRRILVAPGLAFPEAA
jgi:hypothetical protein